MDERIGYPALARPALTCTNSAGYPVCDKQTEQMGPGGGYPRGLECFGPLPWGIGQERRRMERDMTEGEAREMGKGMNGDGDGEAEWSNGDPSGVEWRRGTAPR